MASELISLADFVRNASRVPCACGAHPEGTPQEAVTFYNVDKINIQHKGGGLHFKRHSCKLQCQVCKAVHPAYHDVAPAGIQAVMLVAATNAGRSNDGK